MPRNTDPRAGKRLSQESLSPQTSDRTANRPTGHRNSPKHQGGNKSGGRKNEMLPAHKSAHPRTNENPGPQENGVERGEEGLRLQKYLAQAGVASRRAAENLITDGRVRVNSEIVTTLGTKINPALDRIYLDGKEVLPQDRILLLFHKPRNVVSTLQDPEGRPSVKDYLQHIPVRVFPVGRLDFDVRGLLLLTNDGEWANEFLHPRYEIPRTYQAKVKGLVTARTCSQLEAGFDLEDGPGRATQARLISQPLLPETKRAEFSGIESSWIELKVSEGRNHFVKRLLAASGYPVIELVRVAFGDYQLADLPPGETRRINFPDTAQ